MNWEELTQGWDAQGKFHFLIGRYRQAALDDTTYTTENTHAVLYDAACDLAQFVTDHWQLISFKDDSEVTE